MNKNMVGVSFLIILVASLPIFMVGASPRSVSWNFIHPWGGKVQYVMGVRVNKTEPIPVGLSPRLEFNMWVQEEGSPYFPNYSFSLNLFNIYDESLIENRQVYELTINDTIAWVVQNETFELQESDFLQQEDGWCYFYLFFRGFAFNATHNSSESDALDDTWYQGLAQSKFSWDNTTIHEIQVKDSFTSWEPIPEKTISEPEDTTTEHEVISFTVFSLFMMALVLTYRQRKKTG